MASIFTYNDCSRVSSPWSTPGSSTPQATEKVIPFRTITAQAPLEVNVLPISLKDAGISRLEPEPQEGSTEYKLHLLLRPRRKFSSLSTGDLVSGSQHSKAFNSSSTSAKLDVELALMRPTFMPSVQTRQARLQQLTTQLLWRLQQSSPFHSSSVANLVLPQLPKATPALGLPTRPASVLPGLEESQGALYEIGVADDGTLVGLIEEELEESLTNLKAMAASLGCVVELQRKIIVGKCEWTESDQDTIGAKAHAESLWVAEALVRPDMNTSDGESAAESFKIAKDLGSASSREPLHSDTEQVRIAITGDSTSGKSSLLGVLTISTLDNGRGKSRLSLLKHRHEIASGVTSSVAQELIGYGSARNAETSAVINYSSRDVSSWVDIHSLSHRLIFLSDSPGLSRYAKSTFRTLISWEPHWTIICVAADAAGTGGAASILPAAHPPRANLGPNPSGSTSFEKDLDPALIHLDLCLKLRLPLIVAVTKMDQATKSGLRSILAKLLSTLKAAGRKPALLSTASPPVKTSADDLADLGPDLRHVVAPDAEEVEQLFRANENGQEALVPLILTSAVTGVGISKLHALLKTLSSRESRTRKATTAIETDPDQSDAQYLTDEKLFHVDEVFMIPPSKVYSNIEHNASNQGIVLCGYVKRGKISVGDDLMIGPFPADTAANLARQDGRLRRSSSYNANNGRTVGSRSLPAEFSRPLQLGEPATPNAEFFNSFTRVRIVSLRNLRLPVRSLLPGQVGTIGIIPVDSSTIQRARKGMILTGAGRTDLALTGYHTFKASFPSSDFDSASSPPLILGGHALVYVNSIRAAVKVTAVALTEGEVSEPPSPTEVFAFDIDGSEAGAADGEESQAKTSRGKEVEITFRFVSSVEWMQVGDKVLVVPTTSAAGPVTGPAVATTGLSGFVGIVCELEI